MSEQICLTALLTLPKQQQLGIVERLQQLNQQKEDLTSTTDSIKMDKVQMLGYENIVVLPKNY